VVPLTICTTKFLPYAVCKKSVVLYKGQVVHTKHPMILMSAWGWSGGRNTNVSPPFALTHPIEGLAAS